MALALQRERTACRSVLMRSGAVLAEPEPMLARLVRGCIAMAFTARSPLPADQSEQLGGTLPLGDPATATVHHLQV